LDYTIEVYIASLLNKAIKKHQQHQLTKVKRTCDQKSAQEFSLSCPETKSKFKILKNGQNILKSKSQKFFPPFSAY